MADGTHSRQSRRHGREQRYRLRLLACLAASLLLAIAAARLWPAVSRVAPGDRLKASIYEHVDLREVTQTRHARRASPPPPPPPVPLVETDAPVLQQEPLDFTAQLAPDRSLDDAPPGPRSRRDGDAETSQAPAPDVGARQLRIPELRYTKAARRDDVHARVDVEVVIAPSGRVEEARIVRRALLSGDASEQQPVAAIGYGLEEAALDAARRTLFRPARADGEAVRSRKTITLTFGPGE